LFQSIAETFGLVELSVTVGSIATVWMNPSVGLFLEKAILFPTKLNLQILSMISGISIPAP
jgi:hypothetical protein